MRKLPYPSQSLRFKLGLKFELESGFALISTISVMALVVMIAMAMVSLNNTELLTSQHDFSNNLTKKSLLQYDKTTNHYARSTRPHSVKKEDTIYTKTGHR